MPESQRRFSCQTVVNTDTVEKMKREINPNIYYVSCRIKIATVERKFSFYAAFACLEKFRNCTFTGLVAVIRSTVRSHVTRTRKAETERRKTSTEPGAPLSHSTRASLSQGWNDSSRLSHMLLRHHKISQSGKIHGWFPRLSFTPLESQDKARQTLRENQKTEQMEEASPQRRDAPPGLLPRLPYVHLLSERWRGVAGAFF